MIEAINKIRIERPAWFVFEFLADIEHSPLWEKFNMRAIQTSPGQATLGTEYRLLHSEYERTLRMIEFKQDSYIAIVTVEQIAPKVELRIRLYPEGDQTTLAMVEWKLDTGLPGLLEKLASGKIKLAVSDSLYTLRDLLDTSSVTLQDDSESQLLDG
jgi:hypothetical protein